MVENPPRCNYVLPLKKRTCRMLVKPGTKYCAEHVIHVAESLSIGRIKCPLDQKHTVNVECLSDHLKVCNSRLKTDIFPWVAENINIGDDFEIQQNDNHPKIHLKDIDDVILCELIRKVQVAYEGISHLFVQDYFDTTSAKIDSMGKDPLKHKYQQMAILNSMSKYDFIRSNACFVDFGAGKAKLSGDLSQSLDPKEHYSFLLIERSGLRYKSENKIRKEQEDAKIGSNHNFFRLRCGIEHLDLSKVPLIKTMPDKALIAVCKHLCGTGFDFALNCITNFSRNSNSPGFAGGVLIPCCHHRCSWQNFYGKEAFLNLGLTSSDFEIIALLTSWATCGIKDPVKDLGVLRTEHPIPDLDRKSVGRICKALIDYCRGDTLRNRLNCSRVIYTYFVHEGVTPENLSFVFIR